MRCAASRSGSQPVTTARGDRLAERGQVGADAEQLPAAAFVQSKACAHVVEDQHRSVRVAQLARALCEGTRRHLLIAVGVVTEGRDQDRREIAAHLLGRGLEARDVVVLVAREVRAVFVQHAGLDRRAPGRRAVVGAARAQHLARAGMRARQRHADRGRVGAVLGEQREVGVRDGVDEALGELDHHLARPGQAVAALALLGGGFFDLGVTVAEQVRAVAAQEVDVLPALDVPQVRALPARVELRIARRQRAHRLVAVHAAGDHARRACAQRRVAGRSFSHRGASRSMRSSQLVSPRTLSRMVA